MGYDAKKNRRRGVRPVDLTQDDTYQYERLAQTLLDEVLLEYDHFVTVDRRRVNSALWKTFKHDDEVTIYRERHHASHESDLLDGPLDRATTTTTHNTRYTAFADATSSNTHPNPVWNRHNSSRKKSTKLDTSSSTTTPRLLAIGSVACSLDDAMYGIVTPTASAMRLRASYLKHDDFLDGDVLATIRDPSPDQPFQFTGLKWLLQRGMASGLVRPRDFVYLEASGVQLRDDNSGHRIGFHLMHSVDLPQCSPEYGRHHPANGGSVQRGAFSTCCLYQELSHGIVDVYMTAVVQPRGNILAPIAMRSAAAMLRSNWQSLTVCAETKKLAWMLQTHRQLHQGLPGSLNTSRCGLCSKSLRGFGKKKLTCQLCNMTICSHCSMTRTLRTEGFARYSVVSSEMLFCKKCIARTGEESSSEIARQQIWEDEIVRTGRVQTQTVLALAGRESNGSRMLQAFSMDRGFTETSVPSSSTSMTPYRPRGNSNLRSTWYDTDPTRRYHLVESSSNSILNAERERATMSHTTLERKRTKSFGTGRNTIGTWNGSARATEQLSIGTLDYRTSSNQDQARTSTFLSNSNTDQDAAGRASTASTALVLLDDRKSSRQMKALDYLPVAGPVPSELSATTSIETTPSTNAQEPVERFSMISALTDGEADIEVDSIASSIPVMDLDQSRSDPFKKNMAIAEENPMESRPKHPQPPQPQAAYQSQYQYQPRRPSVSTQQRHSGRVTFQDLPHELDDEDYLANVRPSELLPRPSSTTMDSSRGSVPSSTTDHRLSYQMQLWLQMNELRDTAESTYQITQRNTEAIASQNPQLFRNMRFFAQQPLATTRATTTSSMMSKNSALQLPAQQQSNPMASMPLMEFSHRRYSGSYVPSSR